MTSTRATLALLFLCTCNIVACSREDEPSNTATSTTATSGTPMTDTSSSDAPDYAQLFDHIVQGSLPNATEADDVAWTAALEQVTAFTPAQHEEFATYLESRLSDPSPNMRMEAAFQLALERNDLGRGQENEDLVAVFVTLLEDSDLQVRRRALIDLDPVVTSSGLEDELEPLLIPLIAALQYPEMTYSSIVLLGHIGPLAAAAVPHIQAAAERDNDDIIDQVAAEAIAKIEAEET